MISSEKFIMQVRDPTELRTTNIQGHLPESFIKIIVHDPLLNNIYRAKSYWILYFRVNIDRTLVMLLWLQRRIYTLTWKM